MSGAPREVYAPRHFIIVSLAAVKALDGSWPAAGCFQRIAWRCERDGYWRATMKEIADEIEVSVRTAKRITDRLRELGWITGERENKWDATLTWRVVFEDESATVSPSATDDKAAGQSPEGLDDPTEGATVSPSGVPVGAPSGNPLPAPSESATVAPSLFSETAKTKNETSDDKPSDAIQPTLKLVGADGASSTPTIGKTERADVERLCAHLADRIVANGSKRPTVTQKWRDAARLLMDSDGKSERQVRNMIDWCQSNEFWRSNILSMPTLREKYEQMRLQAERSVSGRAGNAHVADQSSASAQRRRSVLG